MSDKPTLDELRGTLRDLFGNLSPIGCQGTGCTRQTSIGRLSGLQCGKNENITDMAEAVLNYLDSYKNPLKAASESELREHSSGQKLSRFTKHRLRSNKDYQDGS